MNSSKGFVRAFAVIAALVAGACVTASGCGSDNALVGGACADGFVEQGNECVPASADAARDVTGGDVTSADAPTREDGAADANGADAIGDGFGFDVRRGEAGVTDGAMDDGADAAAGDATAQDATAQDATASDATSDAASSDATAADSGGTDSGMVDSGPSDAASDACGPPPLMQCGAICTDTSNDEFNCGRCGNFCPTFICQNGMCVGSLPGDIVLIGHDYFTNVPTTTPQARVLTNSVFLRQVPTVRVLAYERYAANQAVANATGLLNAFSTANNRPLAITATSTDGDIPAKLNTTDFDVLLVFDQPQAPAGALGALGTSWQSTLASYTQAGGVVVVLDGATAAEMPAFVTNAGLLNVTAQTQLSPPAQVVNQAPGDTIGSGVASPYRVTNRSAFFSADAPSMNLVYVIFDQADNAPVVIHKVL